MQKFMEIWFPVLVYVWARILLGQSLFCQQHGEHQVLHVPQVDEQCKNVIKHVGLYSIRF